MAKQDTSDAALFYRETEREWAYLCSHCTQVRAYNDRERAYVWDKATEHLAITHGLRRTWVETVSQKVPEYAQLAMSLVLDHQAKRNASGV